MCGEFAGDENATAILFGMGLDAFSMSAISVPRIKKNIMSLEELMRKSIESGANITACTMSMEVMGITQEELIDGIGYGGVGQYLGATENSNTNLFI